MNIPEPYTDATIMPFGAKKGKPLGEITDGYLVALYDRGKVSGALKEYIEQRVPVLRHRREKSSKL